MKAKRVLLVPRSMPAHYQPFLPVGRHLVEAGHTVGFVQFSPLPHVASLGFEMLTADVEYQPSAAL